MQTPHRGHEHRSGETNTAPGKRTPHPRASIPEPRGCPQCQCRRSSPARPARPRRVPCTPTTRRLPLDRRPGHHTAAWNSRVSKLVHADRVLDSCRCHLRHRAHHPPHGIHLLTMARVRSSCIVGTRGDSSWPASSGNPFGRAIHAPPCLREPPFHVKHCSSPPGCAPVAGDVRECPGRQQSAERPGSCPSPLSKFDRVTCAIEQKRRALVTLTPWA